MKSNYQFKMTIEQHSSLFIQKAVSDSTQKTNLIALLEI